MLWYMIGSATAIRYLIHWFPKFSPICHLFHLHTGKQEDQLPQLCHTVQYHSQWMPIRHNSSINARLSSHGFRRPRLGRWYDVACSATAARNLDGWVPLWSTLAGRSSPHIHTRRAKRSWCWTAFSPTGEAITRLARFCWTRRALNMRRIRNKAASCLYAFANSPERIALKRLSTPAPCHGINMVAKCWWMTRSMTDNTFTKSTRNRKRNEQLTCLTMAWRCLLLMDRSMPLLCKTNSRRSRWKLMIGSESHSIKILPPCVSQLSMTMMRFSSSKKIPCAPHLLHCFRHKKTLWHSPFRTMDGLCDQITTKRRSFGGNLGTAAIHQWLLLNVLNIFISSPSTRQPKLPKLPKFCTSYQICSVMCFYFWTTNHVITLRHCHCQLYLYVWPLISIFQ